MNILDSIYDVVCDNSQNDDNNDICSVLSCRENDGKKTKILFISSGITDLKNKY